METLRLHLIVIEASQYMSSLMNCLEWMLLLLSSNYGVIKKTLKLDGFFVKIWASRHIKCMSQPYSRVWFLNCTNTKIYDIHLRLRLTLPTRISYICSTAVLSVRNFCDSLEMKLTSPLGGIQQAGVPETAAKCYFLFSFAVSDYKQLDTSFYFIITNFHTEFKSQVRVSHDMNSPTLS